MKIKHFCNSLMPSEETKISEFNQYKKSDKPPFLIYLILECLIKNLMDLKIILKISAQQK